MIRKQDFNPNFSNNNLEIAIKQVLKDNSQDNQNVLIEEIKNTYLFTLVDINEKEDENKGSINLLQTLNENKEAFLPVFTNEKEMQEAKEKCSFEEVLLDFDDISGIILDKTSDFKGFIINPASDNIIIEDELIQYMLQKKIAYYEDGEITIKAGEELEIDEFEKDEYPIDMINALKNHFKSQKNIMSSYIRFLNRNGEQSYLLITEFTGDKDDTFMQISQVAKPFLKGIFLDQLEFNTPFGKEVTKDITPFYKKKKLGIF